MGSKLMNEYQNELPVKEHISIVRLGHQVGFGMDSTPLVSGKWNIVLFLFGCVCSLAGAIAAAVRGGLQLSLYLRAICVRVPEREAVRLFLPIFVHTRTSHHVADGY